MKRSGLLLFGLLLSALLAATWQNPVSTFAQAKGWSEEKYIQRAASMDQRVSLPAIAAEGDNIYVAYRQNEIKLTVSRDRGKTWSEPVALAPKFRVTSAPAIAVVGAKILVVFPARVESTEVIPFQLMYVESADQGKNWSNPKRITNTKENTFSPRLLVENNQAHLIWLETPTEGLTRPGERAIDISPESMLSMEVNVNQGLADAMRQVRSIINHAIYNPQSGSFSDASRVGEVSAQKMPHIFSIYGPVSGSLYVAANQNTDIRIFQTRDRGGSWQPYFQDEGYFHPQQLLDVQIIDGEYISSWIRRDPYQQVPVNFKAGKTGQNVQLSAPHFVRSLPRFSFNDGVYHVIWEAGSQEESWLTYIRTDEIPPTSEIVLPSSPEVTARSVTFGWQGEDNISSDDRLVYSYSYGDQNWSPIQPETQATVLAPADGEYEFRVRAEDVAGNIQDPVATFKFNTFKSAPETKITQAPAEGEVVNTRSVPVAFQGDDNSDAPSALQYSAQADSAPWTDFKAGSNHTFANLSNGSHVLRVRTRDSRGNVDPTPAEVAVRVQVGMEIVWDATPVVNSNGDMVTFSWLARDDKGQPVQLNYHYILDKGQAQQTQENAVELTNLEEGTHTLTVWGVDASGDKTPELTHSWLIDRTPPETNAKFSGEYSNKFPIVNLTSTDPQLPDGTQPPAPNQYEYRIGEGEWTPLTISGNTWTVSRPLPFYAWGYKVNVRALDAAGNVDASPATVDLMIYTRTNPYIFWGVVALLVILLLFLLKPLFSRLGGMRRRRPSKVGTSSTFGADTDSSFTSSSSFSLDDDDDLFKDKKDKDDPYA